MKRKTEIIMKIILKYKKKKLFIYLFTSIYPHNLIMFIPYFFNTLLSL